MLVSWIPCLGKFIPFFFSASQARRDIPSFLRVERKVCPTTYLRPYRAFIPILQKETKTVENMALRDNQQNVTGIIAILSFNYIYLPK